MGKDAVHEYTLHDVAPRPLLREIRKEEFESILESIPDTQWVTADEKRTGGRGQLYKYQLLFEGDRYIVSIQRDGVQQRKNVIRFYDETPEKLRWNLLVRVFDQIAQNRLIETEPNIKESENDSLSLVTPEQYLLEKLETKEQLQFKKRKRTLIQSTVSKVHNVKENRIEKLLEILDCFHSEYEFLFDTWIKTPKEPET